MALDGDRGCAELEQYGTDSILPEINRSNDENHVTIVPVSTGQKGSTRQ